MIRTYVLATSVFLLTAAAVHAAATPEQICLKGRYDAAAKYSACQTKTLTNFELSLLDLDQDIAEYDAAWAKFETASGKCQKAYAEVWPKLRKKANNSVCDQNRFQDNGTSVTDWLTGLVWEKKTSGSAGAHNVTNKQTWSSAAPFSETGTIFTMFLPTTNGGGGFAGSSGWRLPTAAELQTILAEPYQCETSPCIDAVFGPTDAAFYWSATTDAGRNVPDAAFCVDFETGYVSICAKTINFAVRAVRGGL